MTACARPLHCMCTLPPLAAPARRALPPCMSPGLSRCRSPRAACHRPLTARTARLRGTVYAAMCGGVSSLLGVSIPGRHGSYQVRGYRRAAGRGEGRRRADSSLLPRRRGPYRTAAASSPMCTPPPPPWMHGAYLYCTATHRCQWHTHCNRDLRPSSRCPVPAAPAQACTRLQQLQLRRRRWPQSRLLLFRPPPGERRAR